MNQNKTRIYVINPSRGKSVVPSLISEYCKSEFKKERRKNLSNTVIVDELANLKR